MDEKDLWLEAHRLLSQAVLVANEAVDAARAQRRYWMEEICANVTADGTLISTSGWKIPTAPKKMVTKKPRIRQEPTAKKPTIVRRKKKDDPNSEPPKKKFKLKMTAAPPPPPNDEEDEEDEDAYQQSSRPPSWEHGYGHHHAVPPGFHRHGGYYTPAQMSYGPHPPLPTSSAHHDMMNVPEELREFMIAGTPKEALAYPQYEAQHAADQETEDEEDEEVDEENDDSE